MHRLTADSDFLIYPIPSLYHHTLFSFKIKGTSKKYSTFIYTSQDILTQCKRLEQAGIEYGFFYLTGISGRGKGEAGAKASEDIFNQLHPFLIGPNMLTIYPESELYEEIQNGNWEEEGELEKYRELRTLVESLNISTYFAAMGASNAFQLRGRLPEDKEQLLETLDRIVCEISEEDLRRYRKNLPHL